MTAASRRPPGAVSHSVLSIGADVTPLALIRVPAGQFVMGSMSQYFSESPPHVVAIRNEFLLGKYPVTQEQWVAVMGHNPSLFRDSPDHPVDSVSWDDADAFCTRLSTGTGRIVRLPSESEWEYACRAGTLGDFCCGSWGPFLVPSEVTSEVRRALTEYAWFEVNSGESTRPVGSKRPNRWGFHDMIGNVWEWCGDVWHGDYRGAPDDGAPWLYAEHTQPRRSSVAGRGTWMRSDAGPVIEVMFIVTSPQVASAFASWSQASGAGVRSCTYCDPPHGSLWALLCPCPRGTLTITDFGLPDCHQALAAIVCRCNNQPRS